MIGHYFQDVAAPSILLDIEIVAAEWIVGQWRDVFDRGKNHGWPPLGHRDLDELCRMLREKNQIGYRVMGSSGIDGFVLAHGVEYRPREKEAYPAEPGRCA